MGTTRILVLAVISAALLAAWGPALAADEKPAVPYADLNGKDLFKMVCKECHQPKAKAGEYTPMTLIQEQWEAFFDTKFLKTHQDLTLPGNEARKVGGILDSQMLQKIRKFCVDHAADSEQPMTCG
jgi:CDP-diacylglycerol pyrophosphatase